MSTTYKQILRAKLELETSLSNAKESRDQWLSSIESKTSKGMMIGEKLSKKELDQSTKGLKNKLLAAKWDFEDLEELLSVYKHDTSQVDDLLNVDEAHIVEDIRMHINGWRNEISQMMAQLEEADSSNRLFNKHGITFHNPLANSNAYSIGNNNGSNKYERLESSTTNQPDMVEDVVQFDKSLVSPRQDASIINNMLYDHLENQHSRSVLMMENDPLNRNRNSLSDPSQVFNNLSRPVTTNVYMNPNESEMILDMLETEYYNPPGGPLHGTTSSANNNSSRIDTMFKKLFDTNRNRFLGTIVFLCSFPTLLLLFMIV